MRLTSISFFKTLIDHEVTVELKNDIQLKGTLKSVDQYLNIKLDDIQVVEELKYPHLVGLSAFNLTCPAGIREKLMILYRAPSRTSSSAAPSCATCTSPPRRWTRSFWRMPLGEVSSPFHPWKSFQSARETNARCDSVEAAAQQAKAK